MGRRKLIFLSIFLLVATAVAVVVYQRFARTPRAALLLPDGDLLVYANLAPLPFVNVGQFVDVDQLPGQSDPQYQDFLRQTNFHVDRDLATIAVSVRNPGDSNSEFAAIFTGKFDQDGLRTYMQRHSNGNESYAGKDIFFIRQTDHVVRACIVDSQTVAIANAESAEPMHRIIDKARGTYLIGEGPSLMRDYHRYVPFGSLVWAMIRMPSQANTAQLPGGMNLDFLRDAVSVISVRYTGSIHLRAEIISADAADAAKVLEAVNTFLAFGKIAAASVSPNDPDKDVKAVFDNIQVQQTGNRTALSVTIPQDLVKKVAEKMNH